MSNIIDKKWTFSLSVVLAMLLNSAWAEGDFPIEGVFTQNEACRGDGSKQEFLRVKISPTFPTGPLILEF